MSTTSTTRTPAGLFRALYERFAQVVREIGKFGVVGATCYALDIVIFRAWLSTTDDPYSATVVSTVIAATAAFLGNRFWTWRHRERSSLTREYTLYFGFNLVGLGISLVCLWTSHHLLGSVWPVFAGGLADTISAKVVGVGLASAFRFWAFRRFVFRPVRIEA